MSEQIERYFDSPKKGGEHKQSKYRKYLKKSKIREERRKAKQDPECFDTYRKYKGYEY
jgi:hypothetical protein